jgi:hypothetical protein
VYTHTHNRSTSSLGQDKDGRNTKTRDEYIFATKISRGFLFDFVYFIVGGTHDSVEVRLRQKDNLVDDCKPNDKLFLFKISNRIYFLISIFLVIR